MIFCDWPRPIQAEDYDEAMALYAERIATRAMAVYRVGSVDFPGLSDLDLLVVVRDRHRDNGQFYSVFDRLPKRLHHVFRHQPTVLPESALDAISHTSHKRRFLIAGDDVLKGWQPLETSEENWCKVLESVCNQVAYIRRCQGETRTSALRAVAMSSSLRFPLRWLDAERATDESRRYESAIDERRNAFFTDPAQDRALMREIWELHCEKARWLEVQVRNVLPSHGDDSLLECSKRVLRGEATLGQLDARSIKERWERIGNYFGKLRELQFPHGDLFLGIIYGERARRFRQGRVERRLRSFFYRTRTFVESATHPTVMIEPQAVTRLS